MNALLSHALIVTPTEHFEGSLKIENGIITDIIKGKHYEDAVSMRGAWLVPGCIDIHSDYFEKEIRPRPSAEFPIPFALHFMDARAAACGITTLLSAISFSDDPRKSRTIPEAIELTRHLERMEDSLLVKHAIHARIDPNTPGILPYLNEMAELKGLAMVIFNENIPGQRQFTLEHHAERYARNQGISIDEAFVQLGEIITKLKAINHRGDIQRALEGKVILGSHDDTTIEHVDEAFHFGSTLSEMPTTREAAQRAKELGMYVCMGAPNYYRGGSHCGNLACHEAMNEGWVDMLCSDYHFPTLLGSVVKMMKDGYSPSYAINMVSLNPARIMKTDAEVGSIEEGKKADLVSFFTQENYPAVSNVWVEGRKVYEANYQFNNVLQSI